MMFEDKIAIKHQKAASIYAEGARSLMQTSKAGKATVCIMMQSSSARVYSKARQLLGIDPPTEWSKSILNSSDR